MPVVEELRDGLCDRDPAEKVKSPSDLTDQQIVDEVNLRIKIGKNTSGFSEIQLASVLGGRILAALNGHCMGPITVNNIVTNYLKLTNGDIAVHHALEQMVSERKLREVPGQPDCYYRTRTR